MKTKVNKITLGRTFFWVFLFFISYPVNAGIPKLDIANLGMKIIENMRDELTAAEAQAMKKIDMILAGDLSGLDIDSKTGIAVTKIQKKQIMEKSISEKQALKDSQPGINACNTILVQKVLEQTNCASKSYLKERSNFTGSFQAASIARAMKDSGLVPHTLTEEYSKVLKRLEDSNPDFFKNGASKQDFEEYSENLLSEDKPSSLIPYYLASSDPNSLALSEKQRQAMEDYVLLIAPPLELTEQEENIVNLTDREKNRIEAERAKYNLSNQVFNSLLSKRVSSDDESASELFNLQQMADAQFSFDDFSAINNQQEDGYVDAGVDYKGGRLQSVASKISFSNMATQEVVIRNIAVMKAFKIHLLLQDFKTSLDQELILATKLANKLK